MVEPLSVDDYTAGQKMSQRSTTTRSSFFNAYLIFSSLCAIAALVIAAVALHKANEGVAFRSSSFISDMERTFNSTVYAIANSGPNAPACQDLGAESVTGQTSIPGQCVTVAESYNMWVTRLASNCVPVIYGQENCTGVSREVPVSPPTCVVAAGAAKLEGNGGNFYKSFKILCT
jgi:hypothetical protein